MVRRALPDAHYDDEREPAVLRAPGAPPAADDDDDECDDDDDDEFWARQLMDAPTRARLGGALAALRARAPQAALERAWASLAPAHVARLARVIADAEASASATLAAGATPQSVLQPMWGAEMGVEARYVPHSSSDLSFISRSGSDLNHF